MSSWDQSSRQQIAKHRTLCFIASAVCCFMGIVPEVQSQVGPARMIAAIDRVVAAEGVSDDSPGLAIGILNANGKQLIRCYGRANLSSKAAITKDTVFELASLSKPITATTILRLHERKELSIQDDIRKYLPELPEYDPSRPIRIVDLLRHVSGLPDYMQFGGVAKQNSDFYVNEDYSSQFQKQRTQHPLLFATGSKYEYNNTNYMLLATILARVSKRSFADVMEQEIFAPAKMSSSFVYENHLIPPVKLRTVAAALGYTGPKGQWQVTWGVPPGFRAELLTAGDGAIWSSVADMIRWDRAWREGLFLKAKTVEMMLKEIKTRDGIATGYGLGFALYPNLTGGLYGFGHDGYWGGFRTSYYRHIESNRTTILLSNREDFDMDAFWYKLNAAIDANLPRR